MLIWSIEEEAKDEEDPEFAPDDAVGCKRGEGSLEVSEGLRL